MAERVEVGYLLSPIKVGGETLPKETIVTVRQTIEGNVLTVILEDSAGLVFSLTDELVQECVEFVL